MVQSMIRLLATWFYLGKLRPGPGTWGTLGATPLVWLLAQWGAIPYMAATAVFSTVAMVVAHLYEKVEGGHDRSEVVIDEVAGFLVAMTWLPFTWQAWLLGFLLFRALDIFKPPPIRWVDRKVPGGVGVVADDLVAGILTNAVLQFVFVQTPWLGYQLNS